MRPSEEIALEVDDCDLTQGKVKVSKARVMLHDKDRTKTGEDRVVELCPRALEVLKRQLALRARLKLAGKVNHENVFFRDDGSQIRNLNGSLRLLALDAQATEGPLPRSVQRPPFLRELEPDDRKEPALGRQTARPQRFHHALHVRGLDRRRHGHRYRSHQTGDGAAPASRSDCPKCHTLKSPDAPRIWHWLGTGFGWKEGKSRI
jgi:integrase